MFNIMCMKQESQKREPPSQKARGAPCTAGGFLLFRRRRTPRPPASPLLLSHGAIGVRENIPVTGPRRGEGTPDLPVLEVCRTSRKTPTTPSALSLSPPPLSAGDGSPGGYSRGVRLGPCLIRKGGQYAQRSEGRRGIPDSTPASELYRISKKPQPPRPPPLPTAPCRPPPTPPRRFPPHGLQQPPRCHRQPLREEGLRLPHRARVPSSTAPADVYLPMSVPMALPPLPGRSKSVCTIKGQKLKHHPNPGGRQTIFYRITKFIRLKNTHTNTPKI